MSDKVFLDIVNMSITGSFAILIIILARLLLKKTPKVFSYALWFVAFFRLLVPVSFESVLSILCPVCGNKTRGADTGGYRAKELPAILP